MTQEPPADERAALLDQVRCAEAVAEGLRSENRRLEAALAVERATNASQELERAHRDLRLAKVRLSRVMRVFDALDLAPPTVTTDPVQFVPDSFLEELRRKQVARDAATAHRSVEGPVEGPVEDGPPRDVLMQPDSETEAPAKRGPGGTQLDGAIQISDDQGERAGRCADAAPAADARPPVKDGQKNVKESEKDISEDAAPSKSIVSAERRPTQVIDESNPAAECLRLLIGASSVAVYEDPRRIKINMINPEKQRELSFWLAWKKDVMEYTQHSVNVESASCPDFLKEYAIEFELAQAPNFLVLVMGAMFDMKIEPKAEPEVQESCQTDQQGPADVSI